MTGPDFGPGTGAGPDLDAGPALVMVPGLAGTAEFFAGTVARLAGRLRIVVVELPGHGGNPTAGRPASLARAVDDLYKAIEERDLADVTLLGWSLGATVAYGYLERFGTARVSGLISVEQTPRLVVDDSWPYGAFGSLDTDGANATVRSVTNDYPAFAAGLVGSSFAAGSEPDPAVLAELTAQAQGCAPDAVQALFGDAVAADWRERIRAITVPTLLVHGARSQVYPGDLGRWLRDAMPAARLEMFDHSGHLPFIEEPDRFARLVAAFAGRPVDG
ncbi:alpha/beta fold hydrolase [Solwaraspora sp. WMMB335]|uniref:alpha/beta fold hydrolase n=1 Tax=Solwaraspora sp. WMMB335 TaxID=3404118 RepID=UPI003B9644D6